MLLVQRCTKFFKFWCYWVSIHYMLLVQALVYSSVDFVTRFQYIICCWFKIWRILNRLYEWPVSIHYMLLVQELLHKLREIDGSFNTLYVVGSISESDDKGIIVLFQYIICCWFKIGKFLGLQQHCSFNTLYVVGSTIFPLVIVNYYQRFNTLYVVGSISQSTLHYLFQRCFNTLYVVGSREKNRF